MPSLQLPARKTESDARRTAQWTECGWQSAARSTGRWSWSDALPGSRERSTGEGTGFGGPKENANANNDASETVRNQNPLLRICQSRSDPPGRLSGLRSGRSHAESPHRSLFPAGIHRTKRRLRSAHPTAKQRATRQDSPGGKERQTPPRAGQKKESIDRRLETKKCCFDAQEHDDGSPVPSIRNVQHLHRHCATKVSQIWGGGTGTG